MLGKYPKPGFSFTQWSHPCEGWGGTPERGGGRPATNPALIWLSLCLARVSGFVCWKGPWPDHSWRRGVVLSFSLALSSYIPKDPLWQGY